MSSFYYKEIKQGEKIQRNISEALSPFSRYLYTTIKSMENKEVKMNWVHSPEVNVTLKPKMYLYEVAQISVIELGMEEGWYFFGNIEPDFEEAIRVKSKKEKIKVSENDIKREKSGLLVKLPYADRDIGEVDWNFEEVIPSAAWLDIEDIIEITQYGDDVEFEIEDNKIITSQKVNPNKELLIDGSPIPFRIISSENGISFEGGTPIELGTRRYLAFREKQSSPILRSANWKAELLGDFKQLLPISTNGLQYQLLDLEKYNHGQTIICSKGIECTLNIPQYDGKDSNRYLLQLIEKEDISKDVFGAKSEVDYFFDDDVSVEIKELSKTKLTIANPKYDEKKIVLKGRIEGRWKFVIPRNKDEPLRLKVNTYQLWKQQMAIHNLSKKPLRHLHPILQLFLPSKDVHWPRFEPEQINDWKVLTDEKRPGNDEQRRFVSKAMATPDFAVLEGPPGSGKTTAILELVCQLVKQGKKILFCGSTHVAIDNVLERLKKDELLEQIIPVRIGDAKRIQEDVREFQIDNILEKNRLVSKDLLLDAANLVCGTTIGILQHPWFKKKKNEDELVPFHAHYDYLIIDECSKTTFQEFLVPAGYAKKWILVGDIQQLSPFADRDPIVSNLKQLHLGAKKELNPELQAACLIWKKLSPYENRMVIRAPKQRIKFLCDEYQKRKETDKDLAEKEVVFILEHPNNKHLISEEQFLKKAIILSGYDLVFIEDRVYDRHNEKLPNNFIVLGDEQWDIGQHGSQFTYWYDKNGKTGEFRAWEKGRGEITRAYEIVNSLMTFFNKKKWGDEVAWRITRVFELSQLGENNKTVNKYKRELKNLLPRTVDISEAVNLIKSIALPSILESIQRGMENRGIGNIRKTPLTEGMRTEDFQTRHEKLSYQHRMHPDISAFPREQFYKEADALKDNPNMSKSRSWNYSGFKKHNCWLDVSGAKVSGNNKNYNEAQRIIKELNTFMKWAKNNPNTDHKDGVWEVAVLTFYRGQETLLREKLSAHLGYKGYKGNRFGLHKAQSHNIYVKLNTVDKFQGQEADIVFLSMVQNKRIGFMDSPNRINVAITRAKFQMVIVGDNSYFRKQYQSEELKKLANKTTKI